MRRGTSSGLLSSSGKTRVVTNSCLLPDFGAGKKYMPMNSKTWSITERMKNVCIFKSSFFPGARDTADLPGYSGSLAPNRFTQNPGGNGQYIFAFLTEETPLI